MATNQQTTTGQWSSTQAYILAVICLVLGVAAGWFLRGSQAPAPAAQQAGATGGMPQGMGGMGGMGMGQQQEVNPEQLKQMADKQAEPLKEQLKAQPNNPELLASIGHIYYDTQVWKEAIEYYTKSLEADPKNPDVRTDMGTAFYRNGDPDRALKEYASALQYSPNHANAMYNRGIVLMHGKNDAAGAAKSWEELLAKVPNHPEREKIQNFIRGAKQVAAQ